jgi:hypothetical protein
MQALDETGDLRAAAGIGGRRLAEQAGAHVAVAEALEQVLAARHRREQGEMRGGGRAEGLGGAAMGIADGLANRSKARTRNEDRCTRRPPAPLARIVPL